jgi:hypothetical protein
VDETDQSQHEGNQATQDRRTEEMTETRTPDDAGSPAAVKERAEMGKDILGSRVAQGEPGEKQPAHDDPRLSASKTVEKLDEIVKQFEGEVYGSSLERAGQGGNIHPVAPEDRRVQRGPQVLAAAATAAGAIGAARDALVTQLESDARLISDPRYERDQKVYELGQQGKLGNVPLSEAEQIALVARTGNPPEVAEAMPKNVHEQIADDMSRLGVAERTPATVSATAIEAGKQDMADKNNGRTAQQEGRTGAEAVQRAKSAEQASSTPPRPITPTPGSIPPGTPIRSESDIGNTAGPVSTYKAGESPADKANAADAQRIGGVTTPPPPASNDPNDKIIK